jgi:hypothetical protein
MTVAFTIVGEIRRLHSSTPASPQEGGFECNRDVTPTIVGVTGGGQFFTQVGRPLSVHRTGLL